MILCEYCIHYDLCRKKAPDDVADKAYYCEEFKSASEYIHLPVRPSDTVFFPCFSGLGDEYNVYECEVQKITLEGKNAGLITLLVHRPEGISYLAEFKLDRYGEEFFATEDLAYEYAETLVHTRQEREGRLKRREGVTREWDTEQDGEGIGGE